MQTDAIAHGLGFTPSFSGTTSAFPQNMASTSVATDTPMTPVATPAPRLWHVGPSPVAGYTFASSSVQIFFVDTASGNLERANPQTSLIERLTNTLMPKIHEALIAPDGATVLRYDADDSEKTFAGALATSSQPSDASTTPMTLNGLYLPNNIVSLALLPSHALVYIIQNPAGGSVVVQSDWKGGSLKKLFTSPLTNWTLAAADDGSLVLVQKPADNVNGYAFSLAGGTLSALTNALPGLTYLPGKNGARLYGTSDGTLKLYAQASAAAQPVLLPIHTSADKCVWNTGIAATAYCAVPRDASDPAYFQNRYQGTRHTSDTWYKVDVAAGTAEEFFVPDMQLDVTNPTIDGHGLYLAFTNGLDHSLWMLRIAP
jgi:hypothetical protein